jgi:A/G-specific adenine glycosylase
MTAPPRHAGPAGPDTLAPALIAWHQRHGRHDLPWQRERTPYRVWISEIMLQQTQVATVIGYYERFMQRFPDVACLAAAPLDEVLHVWSGLGYYSRARNLQRAAQLILSEHGGQLPGSCEALQRLPGIGRSTAAAIAALSLGQRAAILDGNVRRVLTRYFAVEGAPHAPATQTALWRYAEACTPAQQVAVYTQAIMDFGATLCTRSRPSCGHCPLSAGCVAWQSGRVAELPAPRRRLVRPTRQTVMLLATRADGHVLLRRRPTQGVWGGLWGPPEFANVEAARRYLAPCGLGFEALPVVSHAFTHFDLQITPLRVRFADHGAAVEEPQSLWYNLRQPARVGIPAPIAALLASLSESISASAAI